MADHQDDRYQDDGFEGEQRYVAPRRRSTAARGAIVLALVIVLGFAVASWYALDNVRGSGESEMATAEPPLIKAETAPYKRKPEDPGGMLIPNQDKHVYERILPGQPAPGADEKLLPKPEEPMSRPVPDSKPELPAGGTAADQAAASVETAEKMAADKMAAAKPGAESQAPAAKDPSEPAVPAPEAKVAAERLDVKPPAPAPSGPATDKPAPPAENKAAAPDAPPAPAAKPAAEAEAKPKPAASAPVPPVMDLAKSYRIQLAAFREDAEVDKAWQRLKKRYPDELGGLSMHVQKVEIAGKGTYHRLQAGPFSDADAAAAACTALKARKQDCLVVRP